MSIEELKVKLVEEREKKRKLVAPIDKRIKNLETAIKNLESFNTSNDVVSEVAVNYIENLDSIE